MTEPYTHFKVLRYDCRDLEWEYIVEHVFGKTAEELFPEFFTWLSEHAPSATHEENGGGFGFNMRDKEIHVTIPDPDEAVAYRLRWC